MDIALIPPYSLLDTSKNRPFQMILPSCLKNIHYRNSFNPEWRLSDSFIMLDNGMFEDSTMSNENLIELADKYQVDELVMPDVRGNMNATIIATEKFLRMFDQVQLDKSPKLMIVVQVADADEITPFIDMALNLQEQFLSTRSLFTFGLPRRLVEACGPYIREVCTDVISSYAPSNPIHLLGYARNGYQRDGFNETKILANRVRSMDTDAPYVWTYYNDNLSACRGVHERPANYMNMKGYDHLSLDFNIATLDEWARG